MDRTTCVVILAAGEGTRMHSARPKPLHHLCGRPMVAHVLDAASGDDVLATVVVVGHGATWVEKSLTDRAKADAHLTFVEQGEQLGTGHAVSVAIPTIDDAVGGNDVDVLILPGDAPLLRSSTIQLLLEDHRASNAALTVLTAKVEDPEGYGRIVYGKDNKIARIVEERDATPEEREITEVNTSIMVVRQNVLGPALRRVGRANAQDEYYLTDLVGVLYEAGHVTRSYSLFDVTEAVGVNDRAQLASAEHELRRRINEQWMRRGVTMWDPSSTYVDADVTLNVDVSLLPGTVLKGRCVIGEGAQIGPHAYLTDVQVGAFAVVGSVEAVTSTIGEHARVESYCVLGPGAKVRANEVVTAHSQRSL